MGTIIKYRKLKGMIAESIRHALSEGDGSFNIRNVYHVSPNDFNEFRSDINFPYIFFSSKPIVMGGAKYLYTCDVSMHKPLIFKGSFSWSYPLWLYLADKNGNLIPQEEFTPEKYDGYMGCPYEFWKAVYYDDDEYSTDEIPMLVKSLGMGYDGVILQDVDEGDTLINVDDYIVFDPSQVRITGKRLMR